jgi:hypothetical protein
VARLRADDHVELYKAAAGTEATLASVPFTVTLNRSYRLRVEARGQVLEVFVDGRRLISVVDGAVPGGSAGLVNTLMRGDVDNFSVTPLRQTMFDEDFASQATNAWQVSDGSWDYAQESGATIKVQRNVTRGARSITGVATDDQVNSTRVRFDSAPNGDGSWVGVLARFIDPANLYYASLRGSGQVQIRKVANGSATVLKSAPFAVTAGRYYELSFEAIGDRLRVFVDNEPVAETRDATFASGRSGLATNNAAASFANYRSYQP